MVSRNARAANNRLSAISSPSSTPQSSLKSTLPPRSAAMRYAVVIEKTGDNYSAYVPDLPGCVATGATVAEAEMEIREAIRFHIEGLREERRLRRPTPVSGDAS